MVCIKNSFCPSFSIFLLFFFLPVDWKHDFPKYYTFLHEVSKKELHYLSDENKESTRVALPVSWETVTFPLDYFWG